MKTFAMHNQHPFPCRALCHSLQQALHHMLLPMLLLAVLALTACASTTDLLRSSDEAKPAKPAATILIAGISTDDALRRQYETIFIEELTHAGLRGVASSNIIPSLAGLTMPQIREHMLAATDRADAVLHVQLMNLVITPTLSPHDVPAEGAGAQRNVGGVAVTLNAAPEPTVRGTQYAIDLEANLYALPARQLLWTVLTRTHEANSTTAIARSHARALIKAMRKRGYVAAGQ